MTKYYDTDHKVAHAALAFVWPLGAIVLGMALGLHFSTELGERLKVQRAEKKLARQNKEREIQRIMESL